LGFGFEVRARNGFTDLQHIRSHVRGTEIRDGIKASHEAIRSRCEHEGVVTGGTRQRVAACAAR
jgi:hypothetical protein